MEETLNTEQEVKQPVIGEFKPKRKFLNFVSAVNGARIRFIRDIAFVKGEKLSGTLEGIVFKITICDEGTINFEEVDTNVTDAAQRKRLIDDIDTTDVTGYAQKFVVAGIQFADVNGDLCYLEVEEKKPIDKLKSLFTENREDFEKKWNDIKIVIEYGMLSDEKFFDKADKFALYPSVDDKYFTFSELTDKIKDSQTDKDDKLVVLYASNKVDQHSYIETAKRKGYEVLLLDSPIIGHLIQKLEGSKEKISFVRVDSDHIDNLIKKDDTKISKLSDDEKKKLEDILKEEIPSEKFTVQLESMDSEADPFIITQPEFMRRMKEMQQTGGGGGMFGMGNMPEMFNLTVNTNSELVGQILGTKTKKKQSRLISQSLDLAKLSHGLLKGEELTNFIKRSYDIIK